jgi:hypothetical protein
MQAAKIDNTSKHRIVERPMPRGEAMRLQSYYVQAVVLALLGADAANSHADSNKAAIAVPTDIHAAALAELQTIRQYMINPAVLTVEALARQLRFEHSVEQCREETRYQNYCEYTLNMQQSKAARVLALGIGRSTVSNLPGARIDWTPWNDHVCVTAHDLHALLGNGDVIDVNVPYVAHGSEANPPAYRTVMYTAIPHAVPGAQAKAVFRERCVTGLKLIF